MKVPQNGWFIRKTILKWMIWGYHYFRKHPHRCGKHIWCIFQPVGHQLLCGQVSSYWTSRVTSMPPGSWSWLCFMSLGCCFFIFENMFSWENLRNTTWSWSNESPPQKIISTQRAPGSILCSELSSGVSRCSNFTRGKNGSKKYTFPMRKKVAIGSMETGIIYLQVAWLLLC